MLFGRGRNQADRRKQFREIGVYTVIPTMMIVGPLVGWYLGHLAENKWGGEPWPSAGGAVLGFAAAIRQIWLILKRGGKLN